MSPPSGNPLICRSGCRLTPLTGASGTVGGVRFLALLSVFALAEIAAFVWVGSEIGWLWALGIAAFTALVGAYLVSRVGVSAFRRIRAKTREGQIPGRELSDGAVVLVAGGLLIAPGFISDVLGLVLLIPGIRAMIHRTLSKRVSARVTVFAGG